jgi:hypothetical protein
VSYLWDADSNANLHTDCHTDSNSYEYAYPDAKRHSCGYGDSYGATESYTDGDSYSYSYSETNAHCPAASNAQATSYASAAPGRATLIWFQGTAVSLARRSLGEGG